MPYTYSIALTPLSDHHGRATPGNSYTFETTNHDNILHIIERARCGEYLPEKDVAAFCVGLKLLSEVVMTNRSEPVFAEFYPALGKFIRGIKSLPPKQV